MFYRNSTLVKTIISILAIGSILLYIFLNSRVFIKGPQISISFPVNGQLIEEKLIYLTGQTINSDFITVNERVITIDPKGYFEVPYLMIDGKNVIEFKVRDRFNRQVTKKIEVVYNESEDFLRKIEDITNSEFILTEENEAEADLDEVFGSDTVDNDTSSSTANEF